MTLDVGAPLLTAEELLVVVSDLWVATFGIPVHEVGHEVEGNLRWWAAVDLTGPGEVRAEVILVADDDCLRPVAALTFGGGDLADHLLADVLGEAANIIAGNVKGILQRYTSLSAPRMGQGSPPASPDHRAVWVRAGDDRGRWITAGVIDRTPHPDAPPDPTPSDQELRPC